MYGKIFTTMYEGSLIGSGPNVFAVWGYCISRADPEESTVMLNPSLLSAIIGTDVESINNAIKHLTSPDPLSKNKEHEGRRLLHLSGLCYFVVSHKRYRNIKTVSDVREYERERKRTQRVQTIVPECPGQTGTETIVPNCPGQTGTETNVPECPGQIGTNINVPKCPGQTGTPVYVSVYESDYESESVSESVPASKKRRRDGDVFRRPTVEQIRAYCTERQNSVDPELFYNHYNSNGWRVGRNPMKSWQSAVHTWERNAYQKTSAPPSSNSTPKYRPIGDDQEC